MTEPTDDQIYATYFDAHGQPVRAGVRLTPDELTAYRQYFPETTNQTITEESA